MALTTEPGTFIESDPAWRAVARAGSYSVHLNGLSASPYDGFGLVDLTFGPGRAFQFASSVRHLSEERFYNMGMALRRSPGRSVLLPACGDEPTLLGPIEQGPEPASLRLRARGKSRPYTYEMSVAVKEDGVNVVESTPGQATYKSLLIPYVRDCGAGRSTRVGISMVCGDLVVWFRHGAEVVRLNMEGPIEHVLDQPHGFENRRGPCGLLRVDLSYPCEAVRYTLTVET